MSTWTLEHAKAIVSAWPEVEFRLRGSTWARPTGQLSNYGTCSLGSPEEFRLPPKKRLVEWTASDVKPGMVFRLKDSPIAGWIPIESVVPSGVYLVGNMVSWADLINYVHSLDASPGSWMPCAKEVEE